MPHIEVSLVTSAEGFASLQVEWDACLAGCPGASIFQSWEWLYSWWRHYGTKRDLRLAVARDSERVVGILPLYHERGRFAGGTVGVVRLVGTGGDTNPEYLGPIVDGGAPAGVLDALSRAALSCERWDTLVLSDVEEGTALRPALEAAARDQRLRVHCSPGVQNPVVRLPPRWEDYLSTLHRDRRSSIRRFRRRLEERGGRIFVWSDPDGLDQAVDRLIELHHLRWQGRTGQHAFATPQYVAFHRDAMRACLDRGWLRLHCLEIEGQIAAMLYCYSFRDEVSQFQGGFDPRFEHLRPGYVLMGWAIEHAIGEGARVFDMLRGDHAHKETWTQEKRRTETMRLYSRSLRGRLLAAVRRFVPE